MSISSTIYYVLLTQGVRFVVSLVHFHVEGFCDVCPRLISALRPLIVVAMIVGLVVVVIPVVAAGPLAMVVGATVTVVVVVGSSWRPALRLNVTATVTVVAHNFSVATGRSSGN